MPEQEWVYTTKRMQLQKRLSFLLTTIENAQTALSGLVSGEIQSYNLGHYSITRNKPDLEKLQKWIKGAMVEADEIQNLLSGRPARKISTCVYSNPQMIRWYW